MPVLHEDSTETVGGGITLDDERLGEVRHCEDGRRGHRSLEGSERRGGRRAPCETLLRGERREWCCHLAIVADELPVISGQAEEPPDRARRAGYRPVVDGLNLGRIHGNAVFRDGVAEVGDRRHPKRTLGALDEEVVLAQLGEDGTEVS